MRAILGTGNKKRGVLWGRRDQITIFETKKKKKKMQNGTLANKSMIVNFSWIYSKPRTNPILLRVVRPSIRLQQLSTMSDWGLDNYKGKAIKGMQITELQGSL